MKPCEIIEEAGRDGVTVFQSADGMGIKLAGNRGMVNEWLPVVRMHKTGLLQWLELKAANAPAFTQKVKVVCCECANFQRDTVGFGQGIGSCTVEQADYQPTPLWPNAQRVCSEWASSDLTGSYQA
jgi:hypothetical protein